MERSASEPVRRLRIRRPNDLNMGLPGFTPSFVLNTDFENTIRSFREDRDIVKGAMDEIGSMSEKGYVNLSEISPKVVKIVSSGEVSRCHRDGHDLGIRDRDRSIHGQE